MTLSDHGSLENILFNLLIVFFLGFPKYYTHAANGDVKTSHSGTYPLHEDDVEVPVECRNYITIYF